MWKSFLKGLARAFTIPRATRNQITAIAPDAKAGIAGAVTIAAQQAIDGRINDPQQAAAASQAVGIALEHVGLGQ